MKREYPLICRICSAKFSYKTNLIRHLKTKHEPVHVVKIYECAECSKKFSRKDNLAKHIKVHQGDNKSALRCTWNDCRSYFSSFIDLKWHTESVHLHNKNIFKCEECSKTFSRKQSLQRHESVAHNSQDKFAYYECSECAKKYARRDNLIKHISVTHQGNRYECSECGDHFCSKVYLKKHVSKVHQTQDYNNLLIARSMKCVLCSFSHNKEKRITEHYLTAHNINLHEKRISFPNLSEFNDWKKALEDSTYSSFVINSKSKHCRTYCCHRSRLRAIQSRENSRRSSKLSGSKKLDGVCPAKIILRLRRDSTCDVSFFQTHVGHCPSPDEVKHIRLRNDVREELAERISSGELNSRVVNDDLNDIFLSQNFLKAQYSRNDLITGQDVRNIQRTFKVKSQKPFSRLRACNECDIESLIEQHNDSILFYKRPGEKNSDLNLNENDIIIIFMSPAQQFLLRKHPNIVCIDGTYDTNKYGIILQTLLILDYDNEGHPVAFALSNVNDLRLITIFMLAVKEKVGVLNTTVLMTDLPESFYNAWLLVMEPPTYRLFCIWHVREAWKRNLCKIEDEKKRNLMKNALHDLSSELDENLFKQKLEKMMNDDDKDLTEFLNYFQQEFLNNIESWAYCYWRNSGVNTNMHLEAFHRELKYCHSFGKKNHDLSSALQTLINYVKMDIKNLIIKKKRGKVTNTTKSLRKAHQTFVNFLATNELKIDLEDEKWLVYSFTNDFLNERYTVDKIRTTCPVVEDKDYGTCNLVCAQCRTCAHIYRCTCVENVTKNVMCEHIHAVGYCSAQNDISDEILDHENICNVRIDNEVEPCTVAYFIAENGDICEETHVGGIMCDERADDEKGPSSDFMQMRQEIEEEFQQLLKNAKTVDELKMIRSFYFDHKET